MCGRRGVIQLSGMHSCVYGNSLSVCLYFTHFFLSDTIDASEVWRHPLLNRKKSIIGYENGHFQDVYDVWVASLHCTCGPNYYYILNIYSQTVIRLKKTLIEIPYKTCGISDEIYNHLILRHCSITK